MTEEHIFQWPIVTEEDEQAVLDVLRNHKTSGTDITKKFEKEFAEYHGVKYALAHCNGTAALKNAMWACGVGAGDEVICPSMTYWASCTSALSLGAAVNFADIDPDTLCIDPNDIEHRIGPKTKAIILVHYAGYPCEMDSIMNIARKHGVKVIEDVSHAQGGYYKGRMLGTIGDIGAMSLMGGKSFAVGEGGIIVTDSFKLYDRCVAYGHYERTGGASRYSDQPDTRRDPELADFAGLPLGGAKYRMNQTCSAMGRVQLKYYSERIKTIQNAMNRFWDLLEGLPGIRPHRVPENSGSTMGGWYYPRGLYRANELNGISCKDFCQTVRECGAQTSPGANGVLHLHPAFHKADIFNMGQATMISFGQRDVRQGKGALPVSESIAEIAFSVPWFKHDCPDIIETFANAFQKGVEICADKSKRESR